MLSTQYLTENYNFQTVTFATARFVYRAGQGIADDCERIYTALLWLYAALYFALLGLLVLAKALCLVAIPVGAMLAVLLFWPAVQVFLLGMGAFALMMAVRNGR